MRTYKVKSGDSLSIIAKNHGVTVAAIQAANPDKIKNVNMIRVGWVLNIPDAPNGSDGCEMLRTALRDIQNLDSVKKLLSMVGD